MIFEDESVSWALPKAWTPYVNEVAEKHKAHQQQVRGKAVMAMSTQALESSIQALAISHQAVTTSNQAVVTSTHALSTSQQTTGPNTQTTTTVQKTRITKLETRKQALAAITDGLEVTNSLIQLGTAAAGCASM